MYAVLTCVVATFLNVPEVSRHMWYHHAQVFPHARSPKKREYADRTEGLRSPTRGELSRRPAPARFGVT
jgi:hypothetical protein